VVVGYSKASISTILKVFLSKLEELREIAAAPTL